MGGVTPVSTAGRPPCAGVVVHLSGEAGLATGWRASQARPAGHHVHS